MSHCHSEVFPELPELDFRAIEADAQRHALSCYPNESCGLVIENYYVPCENVADDPTQSFKIHKDTLLGALKGGKLRAIIHSHPNGPHHPSAYDMECQLSYGVPGGIIVTNGETCKPILFFGADLPSPPLVGREFKHGITDCYSIIRDYYRMEKGIVIPEFPRDFEWWYKGGDLYSEGFKKAGFIEITEKELLPGDVILAKVASKVINHGAILLENGLILHHLYNRVSRREPAARWRKYFVKCLRYQGQ